MKASLAASSLLAAILLVTPVHLAAAPQGMPSFGRPVAPADLVTLRVEIGKSGAAKGDEVAGTVVVKIADGWHINSAKPLDSFTIPTTLAVTSPALDDVMVAYPRHKVKKFDFAGGNLAVYDGTIRIPFQATRTSAGKADLTATLHFQACNDHVCIPPRNASISKPLAGADGGSAAIGAAAPNSPAIAPSKFTPLDSAPKGTATGSGGLFSGDLSATFHSRGLLLTLLVVFVLGLALTLTPCVYPLIPITIGYFSSQKQGSRAGQILLSVFYVLGIAVTYSVLGVFSALSGRLFGAWLQSSAVLVFFAALMLVLSASMFGLYDIQPPRFIARRAGAKGGYAGALTMGLLAGIVAAPCVGPFVISLIALVAQMHDVMLGFLLFFVLALGLGVPFLILGIFSTAANSMPRSGPWLVQVKKAFGFILVAMAFYFLRSVVGDQIYHWGVAGSLLVGAGFLAFGRSSGSSGKTIRFTAAIILLAGGIFFAIPSRHAAELAWKPYQASAIKEAKVAGRPVMIDFYADWCIPCKELDSRTFTDADVASEASRFVVLKANLTHPEDPETRELTKKYGILGVPTVVFIDSKGNEADAERLVGFEDPARFAERMKRVR